MAKIITIVNIALLLTSCNYINNSKMKTTEIFPKREKQTANFTGDAWVEMLSNDVAIFDAMVYNVTFAPGSRNNWHSHPGGQILLCTSGEGFFQEKGISKRLLKAGDVVEIKPDIVHWHGATPNKEFVHIGISNQLSKGAPTWLGPVTDQEYAGKTN